MRKISSIIRHCLQFRHWGEGLGGSGRRSLSRSGGVYRKAGDSRQWGMVVGGAPLPSRWLRFGSGTNPVGNRSIPARAILCRQPSPPTWSSAKMKGARTIQAHRGSEKRNAEKEIAVSVAAGQRGRQEESTARGGFSRIRSTHDVGVYFSRRSFCGVRPGGNQ